MKPILLLDLGGVVFTSTGRSNPIIDWSVISRLNHKYGHDLNVGKDAFPVFLSEYNEVTQQQLTGPNFLFEIFNTIDFNQELIDFLLPKFRIYIASDNYRENIAYISERYHFADWSEGAFYSFDLEMPKTNPLFFTTVMNTLDVRPEELFLIDDSPKKLAAAAQVGIQGLCYTSIAIVKEADWDTLHS